MESLIKLRLLGSQLKQYELEYFIQRLFQMFGTDIILSFIFNHFLINYNQNKQHNNDLHKIISIISNILNERKHKKSNKKKDIKNDSNKQIFSLNTISSDIISECASYLTITQYLNFAKCNRKIYIACYSPCKLQRLHTFDFDKYYKCDLNRFLSLKSIALIPIQFNEYIQLHPKQKQFHQLNTLQLYNKFLNNIQHVNTFMSTKCIKFENISHLSLQAFGLIGHNIVPQLYDFNCFCNILMKCSNVIGLHIDYMYLTQFNNKNISKLLPKLSMISVGTNVNESVFSLQNTLLTIHSNNIISFSYDSTRYDINIKLFPKLKELVVKNPIIDSLHKIIKHAPDLETIKLVNNLELNENETKEAIITLFKTCNKLKRFIFTGMFAQIQKIIQFIEMALFSSNNTNYKEITLVFTVINSNMQKDDINLSVLRIINALDSLDITNFMVGFHISKQTKQTFEKTVETLENKYVAILYETPYSIIISNVNCTINGYSNRWINKLANIFDTK